jgi:hypothetical protein
VVPLEREKPIDRDFKELEQKPWFYVEHNVIKYA